MNPPRTILHVDMDAFYASVELRERPELRGKPVAVGGSSGRGVLTTCNYEARRFGCRSAMPVFQALRLCPELVCLPVRFDLYRRESERIRALMRALTPRVEPLSLDEAFLDLTGLPGDPAELALGLKAAIRAETGLTASAGLGPNKLVAKIASDWRKPDGFHAVPAGEAAAFLAPLPVRRLWGVGPRMEERLERLGIRTCAELATRDPAELEAALGKFGPELVRMARGDDDREVEPDQVRRSMSTEHTFDRPLRGLEACGAALRPLVAELREEYRQKASDRVIRSAVVKVKFSDFRQTTKETLCPRPRPSVFRELLAEALSRHDRPVRLLGVGIRFADPGAVEEDPPGPRQLEFPW